MRNKYWLKAECSGRPFPRWSDKIQASQRKYQCLGFFGFAGDNGFSSSCFTTDMLSIFSTRL